MIRMVLAMGLVFMSTLIFSEQAHAFTFRVDPSTPQYARGQANLYWNASDAAQCNASGGWSGKKTAGTFMELSEFMNVTQTTEFFLECFDASGASLGRKSGKVTITPEVPKPTITFKATPPALPVGGGQVRIAWTVKDATTCTFHASDAMAGDLFRKTVPPTDGGEDFNLTKPTGFDFSCVNEAVIAARGYLTPEDSVSANLSVTVDNGLPNYPSVYIALSPGGYTVPGGQGVIIWQVYDNGVYPPATCKAVDWLDNGSATLNRDGPVDISGYHRSTPFSVTAPRTFSIECTNKWGTFRATTEAVFRDSDGGSFTPPQVDPRKCGNGKIDPGEACDRGTGSNGFCPAECSSSCAKNDCSGPVPPPLPLGPPAPPLPPGPPAPPLGDGTCQAPNTCVSGGCAPDKYKPASGTCANTGDSCCTPLALPSPGVGYFNPLKYNSLDSVLTAVLSTLQSIVVILSIIMIIVGAVMYILSAGNESRVSQAKVAITASVVGLALAIAAPAFLKEIGELLGWIEVTQVVEEAQTFTEIASKVLSFLLSIVGIIAIIMLVIGGLMYLTAGGDEGKAETGKKIVTYATIAIAIALAALVMVTQVAQFFG